MAIVRPVEIERVRDEERMFGGDIVWWLLLLIVSVPVMLWGLAQTPETGGFVFLALGGIGAGVSFARVAVRLPYLTNHFSLSMFLAIAVIAIIGLIALVFNMSLPVPTAPLDVMYKPPVSGG
jgi:F0F1-type ATP synthase membrane subunit c/vacuolar-type H+-ATPase subunit K